MGQGTVMLIKGQQYIYAPTKLKKGLRVTEVVTLLSEKPFPDGNIRVQKRSGKKTNVPANTLKEV